MLINLYTERFNGCLRILAKDIEKDLQNKLDGFANIDRITARAKSIDRFIGKAEKLDNDVKKYSDPLKQIQDQVGVRVVVFYLNDVETVSEAILKYYRRIEERVIIPDSEKEFGYEGKHFILLVPTECIPENIDKTLAPTFFELQIKTLYQHAFSEASHDLGYKPGRTLSKDQNRKIAFTAAQSWGADQIFSDLINETVAEKKLNLYS